MNDFNNMYDVGIVPGIKLNYKIKYLNNIAIEPYMGVSVPIAYSLTYNGPYIPFPVLTLGIRFGLNYVTNIWK